MKSKLVCTCFLLLLCISEVYATDPAVLVTIGSDALASGVIVTLPNLISSHLENTKLPDITGTTREFLVLQITYNISQLVFTQIELGSIDLVLNNNGFSAVISDVVCTATFNWAYEDQSFLIIHIKDSGTGDISFYGGTYQMAIEIDEQNGRPNFDLQQNNLKLSNFDLDLDANGQQWFYDLFNFVIQPAVKSEIESKVEDAVSAVFAKLNTIFSDIPTNLPLPGGIAYNWALLEDFQTQSNGFGSFYTAGYFVPQNNLNAVPPFSLPSLPAQVNLQQLQVTVAEYTFDSLGWALYQAGSLNVTLPFGTTADWRLLLPALYRAYPNAPLEIEVLPSNNYPNFEFNHTTGATLDTAPYLVWYAIVNDTRYEAFTLLVEIDATVYLYFNSTTQTINGNVGVPDFSMSLNSANIGSFSLFQLQTAINTVIYAAVLPTVNRVLREGIPIPVIYGVTLQDPSLVFEEDYLYLTTDITYEKPTNATMDFMSSPRSGYTFVPAPLLSYL